jgi:hypothetical protein
VAVFNVTLPDRVIPWITRDQYRVEPTSVETSALIRGGSQADQDAALDRLILQASSWCDKAAEQPLTAQLTTEALRAEVTREGLLRLAPRQSPIVSVSGISWGNDPSNMTTLTDLSKVWVEDNTVEVPIGATLQGGWSGALQISTPRPHGRLYVTMTYVAGFPVTTLASGCSATDQTITVKDSTGVAPGVQLRLLQGGGPSGAGSGQSSPTQATVQVLSVLGNDLTLNGPVGAVFGADAAVTGMPAELDEACILLVTAFIKQGGSGALIMKPSSKGGAGEAGGHPGDEEIDRALAILEYYRPLNTSS